MKRHTLLLLLIFAGSVLLKLNPAFAAPGDVEAISRKYEVLIKKARAGDVSAAEELAKISRKAEDVAKIDDVVLRDLASLLDSSSEPVRGWAAAAIGHFGPRAASYAPQLQKIVSEDACNMTGVSAADAASVALQRLGVTPAPLGCTHK